MPAVTPFASGFDAYHLDIARPQNPYCYSGPMESSREWWDGWDTAQERNLARADEKHASQTNEGE